MAGLFDRVKDLVEITSYIELETGGEARRAGSGSWRLNPCPFCGHKDCFTINDKEQFYKCFSCKEGGDVIEFEQQYRKLGSPLEAAMSIAAKRGMPVLDGEDGGVRVAREPDQKQKTDKKVQVEEDVLKIDPERACDVRRMAAEYYHGRLLEDRKAWSYQVDVRKHSPEILKRLKAGLGGGNLIAHAKNKGVSLEELAAVGLAQEHKTGWRATVSNGVFVYPHESQGKIQFFSLKDPEKKRPWQLKKRFAPVAWLCYGQDVLDQDGPVIIVEGENDRITVMDLGGHEDCMATIASYNEPAILERLKTVAKGRAWYLGFDNDPPPPNKPEGAGARYTRIYANTLLASGGDVRVIEIPPGKDGAKSDIDDILRLAEDPKAELERLKKAARKIAKPIPGPAGASPGKGERGKGRAPNPPPPSNPDAYTFASFEVLGELQDERILLWSKINERLYSVALKDFNLDKLVQIGGAEVAARVARSAASYSAGQVLFADVKKRIIVQAGKRQLWNPEYIGQGIHGLDGDELVLVVGGRAWVWDGKSLVRWEHPVIEGRLIDWRQGYDWVNMDDVVSVLARMDNSIAIDILDELMAVFFQWGFSGKLDVWLICGWYLAQYLQSMWAWRPHLWLTGTAGSGKTVMKELLVALGGRLALPCEGQTLTEPGLRQSIGCDSVLVAIDEIEKSQHREQIIYYIRSAGRGGITRKGSSSQKAVEAKLRHMVFLASIERGIYRAAENSRYLTIETKKSSDRQPYIPKISDAAKMRAKIVAYVLWASFRARELLDKVGKIGENDPRFIESLSVPFSMIAVTSNDGIGTLTRLLTDYLNGWRERFQGGILEDEEKLIEDIMMAQVRLPEETEGELRTNGYESSKTVYVTRMVSQLMVAKHQIAEEPRKVLEAHGLKPVDGNGGLFLHPDTVVKALLKGTQWQGLNIRDMLLRIVGAEARQLRLGGSRVRGVVLPWQVFGF